MKKLLILPALALLLTVGVFSLGQHSKSAHAAGPTVTQTGQHQVVQKSAIANEKPDGVESATETKDTAKGSESKGTETDGPGGHQDTQGANVNHDFQGAE